MKTSIPITASLLAAFASAAPLAPPPTVNLLLETAALSAPAGEGDTATVISIPFGTLFNANATSKAVAISVSRGENVPIKDQDIRFQCFFDAIGTTLLGKTFDNVLPGVDLSKDQPVQIGSIFCSDAKGVSDRIAATAATTAAPAAGKGTVRIQIDFSGEGAAQGVVPVNGQVSPTSGAFATAVGSNAFITSADGIAANKVSCQTFSDAAGKVPLAKPFGGTDTVILGTDVPVGAFKCSAV